MSDIPMETETTAAPEPSPSPRWPRLLFIALPVLVIGAGVAFWNFRSSTDGASSPQAAVERLVRAIADEDPLGVIAALDPTEGDVLRDAYEPAADQAESQDLVADKGDPLESVDVRAEDLRYETEELGKRVAAVRVTDGNFDASFEPSKLPAKTRRDLPPDFDRRRSASVTIDQLEDELGDELPPIVTIKRDGGWYVSVFYTIAEGIRTASDLPQPDFDNPPSSRGADSPKDVIAELAAAMGALDLDKGLQLIDPESLQVLVDYRDTIESQFDEDDIADARKDFSLTLDSLDVTTTKLDDVHTRVDVKKLAAHGFSAFDEPTISAGSQGFSRRTTRRVTENGTFTLDGTCYTSETTRAGEKPERDAGCLSDTGHTFGIRSWFVIVAKRGDQYYFDPLRTIEEYAHIVTESKDFKSFVCEASGDADCE